MVPLLFYMLYDIIYKILNILFFDMIFGSSTSVNYFRCHKIRKKKQLLTSLM